MEGEGAVGTHTPRQAGRQPVSGGRQQWAGRISGSSIPKPPRAMRPVLCGPFDFTVRHDQEGRSERCCLLGVSAHLWLAPCTWDEVSLCWAEVSLSTPVPRSTTPHILATAPWADAGQHSGLLS